MKKILLPMIFIFTLQSKAADTFNFRFSPVLVLVGAAAVNLDIAVSNSITIGPQLLYWNLNLKQTGTSTQQYDYKIKASSYGVRLNWFKNNIYTDGLYLGLAATRSSVSVEEKTTTTSGSSSGTSISALAGYGWFWNSFNQMLGAGFSTSAGDTKIEIKDSNGTITDSVSSPSSANFTLEYSLGWTF
jgi:hypothetical protein